MKPVAIMPLLLLALSGTWVTKASEFKDVAQPIEMHSIVAGGYHTCGLSSVGVAYCWGRDEFGQLGNGGDSKDSQIPVQVSGGITFKEIVAGREHTCGLTSTGVAYCWGRNISGQLGNGGSVDSQTPVQVSGGIIFKQISAGQAHTCGLTSAGVAYCWGSDFFGQLGNGGDYENSQFPTKVAGKIIFKKISAGQDHTCGLTLAGVAYCWGWNEYDQLGKGGVSSQIPVKVLGGITFKEIAAGGLHTCGLTSAGIAYCWGWNRDGQLGNGGSGKNSQVPTKVAGKIIFKEISAGEEHTCGLTSAGVAYCWGCDREGQLGNGQDKVDLSEPSSDQYPTSQKPFPVTGGITFKEISACGWLTCGLTSAGVAYCWGEDKYGQLGDGGSENSQVPVKVEFKDPR